MSGERSPRMVLTEKLLRRLQIGVLLPTATAVTLAGAAACKTGIADGTPTTPPSGDQKPVCDPAVSPSTSPYERRTIMPNGTEITESRGSDGTSRYTTVDRNGDMHVIVVGPCGGGGGTAN